MPVDRRRRPLAGLGEETDHPQVLPEPVDELGDGRVEELEQQLRVDAEDDDGDQHRRPGDPLDGGDVLDLSLVVIVIVVDGRPDGVRRRCVPGELRARVAEGRALVQPQQVGRGEHRAQGGEHHQGPVQRLGQPEAGAVRRQDRRELAPEAGEAGQAEARHGAEPEDPPEPRHLDQETGEAPDLERVIAVLDRPGEEEQHPGDQAVGDHPEHRGVDAEGRQGRDAEHHESHVGDGREGDEPLHVRLGEAAQGAVQDAEDGEDGDHGRPRLGGFREERDADAHEPVGAQLQEDGGQDHRTDGRSLGVGVGQPGVEREHRDLDGEADEHPGEDPDLHGAPELRAGVHQVGEGEALGAGLGEQGQERHEHQCRAEHRVEEELQRGVLALLAAPRADEEVHRQQHDLEEDEEQDQVLGDEGAGHAHLQDEDQHQEGLDVARLRHVPERVDDRHEGDEARQHVQRQADPVDTDRVVGVDGLDPRGIGEELQARGLVEVELGHRVDAHGERRQRRDEGDLLVQELLPAGDEHHRQHADERQERADAQHPVLIGDDFHAFQQPHTLMITSTMAPTAAAPNSSPPYWLSLPDCTGCSAVPVALAIVPEPLTAPSTTPWSMLR